jgi:hypothetical protein
MAMPSMWSERTAMKTLTAEEVFELINKQISTTDLYKNNSEYAKGYRKGLNDLKQSLLDKYK